MMARLLMKKFKKNVILRIVLWQQESHVHILLTMWVMDADGEYLPVRMKMYDLGENGERIRLSSRCR